MQNHTVKFFSTAVLALVGIITLNSTSLAEEASRNFQVVDNVAIYLGMMPAQIVKGHPRDHTESKMHGGVDAGNRREHLVIALFENSTGKRIEKAKVTGEMTAPGIRSQRKILEPMLIAGAVTYGNYFNVSGKSTYHIKIEIVLPGESVIEAKFLHKHFGK